MYSGGAELLFDKIKEHKVTLDSKENCKSSLLYYYFFNKERVCLIILIYHLFLHQGV